MQLSLSGLLDSHLAPAPQEAKVAWLRGVTYAHRGLHGLNIPENSPAAFARAMERGLGIECDVQRSAVAHHADAAVHDEDEGEDARPDEQGDNQQRGHRSHADSSFDSSASRTRSYRTAMSCSQAMMPIRQADADQITVW